MDSKGKRYCTTRQETNISNVLDVFERLFNVFIIIRCVELIMYNEHVVSFRQKPLSIVLLPLLLINNFIAAAQLNSPSSKRNNLDSSICMLIISLGISRNTVPAAFFIDFVVV